MAVFASLGMCVSVSGLEGQVVLGGGLQGVVERRDGRPRLDVVGVVVGVAWRLLRAEVAAGAAAVGAGVDVFAWQPALLGLGVGAWAVHVYEVAVAAAGPARLGAGV